MSPLICSLLDYDHTTLYIEPYGGGCRTLLNKKPHESEIYNDFGFGLTNFFEVMSKADRTERLIDMLLENPPSKEQFQQLVIKRMAIEDRLNTSTNAIVSAMAWQSYKDCGVVIFRELRQAINREDYRGIIKSLEIILSTKYIAKQLQPWEEMQYKHYYKLYRKYWALVLKSHDRIKAKAEIDFEEAWKRTMELPKEDTKLAQLYEKHKAIYSEDCAKAAVYAYTDDIVTSNESGATVSDLEIAFIIFQLYYSSRDGMGTVWSEEKNSDGRAYVRAVSNLRNISERMRNVMVTQCDALDLIRLYRTRSDVMLYLDPSYLNPEDEQMNLGEVYKMSYEYQDHEKMLREIAKSDTRAKILVSNYDVELYNKYLCDWKKTYYKTFTGVGSKKGNRRLEVLWQNY